MTLCFDKRSFGGRVNADLFFVFDHAESCVNQVLVCGKRKAGASFEMPLLPVLATKKQPVVSCSLKLQLQSLGAFVGGTVSRMLDRILIPALPLTCCVALRESLHVSASVSPYVT